MILINDDSENKDEEVKRAKDKNEDYKEDNEEVEAEDDNIQDIKCHSFLESKAKVDLDSDDEDEEEKTDGGSLELSDLFLHMKVITSPLRTSYIKKSFDMIFYCVDNKIDIISYCEASDVDIINTTHLTRAKEIFIAHGLKTVVYFSISLGLHF